MTITVFMLNVVREQGFPMALIIGFGYKFVVKLRSWHVSPLYAALCSKSLIMSLVFLLNSHEVISMWCFRRAVYFR
jgi:hypothetical protein